MQPEPGPDAYRPFPFLKKPGISTGDCLEEPVFQGGNKTARPGKNNRCSAPVKKDP